MFLFSSLNARPAAEADRELVTAFSRTAAQVHAHLDWRPAEDWLGTQPFLLAERGRRTIGVLVCPPDPPDTAWVRLFALAGDESPQRVWKAVWPPARAALEAQRVKIVAGLSLDRWMEPLYAGSGFDQTHNVVVLTRRRGRPLGASRNPARVRVARADDHSAIVAADLAAFTSPWQISSTVAQTAIAQAAYLTVAELEGEIVGYQLTTPNPDGAHLARLAVFPRWQGRGVGYALVADLVAHSEQNGAHAISVNTQDTNAASLAVYRRAGFELSGPRFPVFQLQIG
jgi:ribosomal-protein-alanine N-acetyltransferase